MTVTVNTKVPAFMGVPVITRVAPWLPGVDVRPGGSPVTVHV